MEFGGDHQHHHRDEEDEDEEEEEGSEEALMLNNNNSISGGTNPNNHHHINSTSSSLNRVKMVEASFSQVQIHQPINPTPPPPATSSSTSTTKPRYRECLRNHAINVMGHALDGCGEFMPGGPEGSVEALKCAACSCHRNFHRKEDPTDHHHTAVIYTHSHLHHHGQQHTSGGGTFGSYYRTTSTTNNTTAPSGYLHLGPPPQPWPLALASASGGGGRGGSQSRGEEEEEEDVSDPTADAHLNGVGSMNMTVMMMRNGSAGNKKRFRTKFTAVQKERMYGMAERIGWRIQKCDEDLVQQFCNETSVKRHVFKVWMHNNKHTLGKQSTTTPTSSNPQHQQQQQLVAAQHQQQAAAANSS